MTTKEALKELMNKWDTYQAKWVTKFGTDEGFGEWFSKQLGLEAK